MGVRAMGIVRAANNTPCAVRRGQDSRAPAACVGVSLRRGQSRRIEPVARIRRVTISRRKNLMRREKVDPTGSGPTAISTDNSPCAVRHGPKRRAPTARVGVSLRHGQSRRIEPIARIRRASISRWNDPMHPETADPTGTAPIAISANKSPCAVRHSPKRRAPMTCVGIGLSPCHRRSRRINPDARIRPAPISRRKNLMRPENADPTGTAPTPISANKSPCAVSKRRKHTASASNAINPAATRFAIAVHAGSVGGLHLVKASNRRSTQSNGEQTQP